MSHPLRWTALIALERPELPSFDRISAWYAEHYPDAQPLVAAGRDGQQQPDHLHFSFTSCQQERRHSGTQANLEIRSGLDQLPCGLDIAFGRRPDDRGLPAYFLRVDWGAFREQRSKPSVVRNRKAICGSR